MRAFHSLLVLTALATASCQPGPVAAPVGQPTVSTAHREVKLGDRPLGIAAAGGFVYVSGEGQRGISVLDTAKNDDLVKTLTFEGSTPGILRAFVDRSGVLVLDAARGEVMVLDAGKQHEVLQRVAIGPNPVSMALSEDNQGVLVGLGEQAGLVHLQFSDNRRVAPTITPFSGNGSNVTSFVPSLDFKGGLALIGQPGSYSLYELRKSNLTALGMTELGGPVAFGMENGRPSVAILCDPKRDEVVLTDFTGAARTVIGNAGKTPQGIAIDPELKRAYVAMAGSGEVAVIDYEAKTLVARLPVGGRPNSVQMAPPLPNEVWVGSDDGMLSVIDGARTMVKHQVPIGPGGHRFTYWGTKGYVTNDAAGSVTIIDRTAVR